MLRAGDEDQVRELRLIEPGAEQPGRVLELEPAENLGELPVIDLDETGGLVIAGEQA